ncbi:MAG: outer membrane lipoprotein carrier protein LolA [Deltaproteobacteria bacterium]|nr:outer membrane lipoprotein carrier protein LolA [Deltaproteobacteria bacterium]
MSLRVRRALPQLVLLLVLPLCAGWSGSWEEIRKAAEQVRAMRADFVQRKHLPILAQPLTSTGSFAFRRPEEIRWEYASPLQSILLLSKDEVRRFVRQGERLVPDASAQLEAMRVVLAEIGRWLAGRFEESVTFAPRLEPGTPTLIQLTPRDPAMTRFIQHIEIELGATPGVIAEVRIHEGPQAYTVIHFDRVQLLPELPDELFRIAR